MKLILHIGTEKTGSSTIQHVLKKNQKTLLDNGYFFINSTRFGLSLDKLGTDSRILAAYCTFMEEKEELFRFNMIDTPEKRARFRENVQRSLGRQLRKLPGHVHTIIASSEHFHSRLGSVEEVARLRELFAPYVDDTEIICYLRNQADTVVSLYSTALKGGATLDLDTFIETKCEADGHYFNYDQFIGKWEQVYGQESINLRIFSKHCFINNDLLDDFLAQIDPQLSTILNKAVEVKNESINHLAQVLARSINKHIPLFIKGVGSNADNTDLKDMITNRSPGKGLGLSPARHEEISSWFTQSNENVRQRYFPGRVALFDTKQAPDENRMLSSEQEAMLDDVVSYLVKRNVGRPQRKEAFRSRYANSLKRARGRLQKSNKQKAARAQASYWQQVTLFTKGMALMSPKGTLRNPLCINNASDKSLQFAVDDGESCTVGWQVFDKDGDMISGLRGIVRIDAEIDAHSMGMVSTAFSINDQQQRFIVDNGPCFVRFCIVAGDEWLCDSFPLQSAWSVIMDPAA